MSTRIRGNHECDGHACDYCNSHQGDDEDDEDEDPGESDNDSEIQFADPGGTSALRATTASNPRNLPCPTCGKKNCLTPADKAAGYQCDSCADRAERGEEY